MDKLLLEILLLEVAINVELEFVLQLDGYERPIRAEDHVVRDGGLLLLLAPFLLVTVSGEIVHSDSQEHVEEDEVAGDEEEEKVDESHGAESLDAAVGLDTVVHHHVPVLAGQDLKHGEAGLEEIIEGSARFIVEELSTEELHAKQGKDEDEETEQNEQSHNGGNGVNKRLDQVTHSRPVSAMLKCQIYAETFYYYSYFVTLNPLSRRIHLNTDKPIGGMSSFLTRRYSRIELITTKKSNLLKSDIM